MNKSYSFHDADLYINGEKVDGFVDESVAISAKAKVKILCITTHAPQQYVLWRTWVTNIRSNFSTTIWATCTKPTKRQLRKWKKYVRQL